MSKKKRSKILAAVLCATTMAAFYASPQMVYAVNLNHTPEGIVTTDSSGDNEAITEISGLAGITFGVEAGEGQPPASVRLGVDLEHGGLYADGSITAKSLYLALNNGERYDMDNVLGIERDYDDKNNEYITSIEAGASGGGIQITNKQIGMLDGAAVFTEDKISFDADLESTHGIKVNGAFEVTSQGNVITTGTINSMTIANNQVNGVTLLGNEVTANEVTAGGYKLTQVGQDVADMVSNVKRIDEKTTGITRYDADNAVTYFNGDVRASGDLITNSGTITDTDGNEFEVAAASEAIKSVGDLTTRMDTAEGEIDTLQGVVGDNESGLVKNVNDLNTKTTGMSYNDSTGTTFEQEVNATDFKIGDTSLNAVAQAVNDPTKGLTATNELANDNKGDIATINSTINNPDTGLAAAHTKIGALDGRVTTAEGEIDALQIQTHNISSDGNSITNLTNLTTSALTATTGTVGGVTFNGGEATGLTNISGASITVAGNTLTNGSFNGVSIADRTGGATINGISIYQDQSTQDYYVGNVNISDLTSGSGVTIAGIERSENGEGGYITTIEQNLKVNTNGEIANHNNSFKVAEDGTVTAKDFAIKDGASLSGVASNLTTAEGEIDALQTTVGNADSGLVHDVNGLTDTVSGHTTSIEALETTVGNESGGLVKDVNDLENTVGGHTDSIKGLTDKTQHFNDEGNTLTNMTNIETDNITATEGTIGGIGFESNAITNVQTIGTANDIINLAGNAITKGSFNGVAIGVESGHATFNGVSIYKDEQNENDVMVGGINLSDLQSGTTTKLEGIVRKPNEEGGGYTTTIEGALKVNSATHEISNDDDSFKVAEDGTVTGTDFVIDDNTKLSTVAQATTGMTYTPAADGKEAVTSFDHQVKATNVTTTAGADLNALSETVNNEQTGLVTKVGALETKTTDMSYDKDTKTTTFSNNLKANNFEATTGKLGNISFSGSALGNTGDTITIAGAAITSNSFNEVLIEQKADDHYWVGDVDVSALEAGNTEITNKLRGITYSNEQGDDYTMTFAGVMSVSTTGEYEFNYKGKSYGLDDLINTVDVGDLDKVKDLATRVDKIEDKTTGIYFDEETGSTTIFDMNKNIEGNWEQGKTSLVVGNNGITANGDTVINGDATGSGSGEPGTGTEDGNNANTVNGDQLVDGNQHVTGDAQFDGKVTFGEDANDQMVIDGGTLTTGTTTVAKDNVTADNGYFGNIVAGEGDNQTTINDNGVQVGENTSITNEGISVKDDLGGVNVGDHDVTITDSEGNVEASLSDVAQRVDGISESISDLNSRMGELEDRIDKVGAMAAAIANLRTMGYDPAAPTEIAVGIGQYRSETGAALGLFHYPNRDFMLSLSVSTSGDEVMGGIGATWKFGRKSPEKAAAEKAEKAKAAKLQKAEAIKEAARLKKVEAQQQRHAKLAAEKAAK